MNTNTECRQNMKHKNIYFFLFLVVFLLFSFVIIHNAKAQWRGGAQDGYAMVRNADCAAYPPYPSVLKGGAQDGYAMVRNADCASYPPYPNILKGGPYDGYALVRNADCAPYPPYPNILVGGPCSGESGVARTCSTLWTVPSCRMAFGPLPIELLSFSAEWLDNDYSAVLLQWSTASEINNDYFVVERSTDISDFSPVLQVDGAGNSTHRIDYMTLDKKPFKTVISYYRLKQIDFDGKSSFSHIEVIAPKDGIDIISIIPNPSHDKFEYVVAVSEATKVLVSATDVLGRTIIENTVFINKGLNKLNLNISWLSAGVYVLQVSTESGLYKTHKQFVKE